jgi:hypothetical protein
MRLEDSAAARRDERGAMTGKVWFEDLRVGQRHAAGHVASTSCAGSSCPAGRRAPPRRRGAGARPSRSKLQGIARVRYTLFNQRDEPVYGIVAIHIVPTRP